MFQNVGFQIGISRGCNGWSLERCRNGLAGAGVVWMLAIMRDWIVKTSRRKTITRPREKGAYSIGHLARLREIRCDFVQHNSIRRSEIRRLKDLPVHVTVERFGVDETEVAVSLIGGNRIQQERVGGSAEVISPQRRSVFLCTSPPEHDWRVNAACRCVIGGKVSISA